MSDAYNPMQAEPQVDPAAAMQVAQNPELPSKRPAWDDVPDVELSRAALVKEWEDKVKDAKKYWEKFFKRTRECEQLAFAGADKSWVDADSYTVPVIPRHINQSGATLSAKDP